MSRKRSSGYSGPSGFEGANEKDLQQLKQLLPGLSGSAGNNMSQADVMKAASKYIDHLQSSLICKIRTHGYPEKLKPKGVPGGGGLQDSESIKQAVNSYLATKKWT